MWFREGRILPTSTRILPTSTLCSHNPISNICLPTLPCWLMPAKIMLHIHFFNLQICFLFKYISPFWDSTFGIHICIHLGGNIIIFLFGNLLDQDLIKLQQEGLEMNEAQKAEVTYKENKWLLVFVVFQHTFSSPPLVFHVEQEDLNVLHNLCAWILAPNIASWIELGLLIAKRVFFGTFQNSQHKINILWWDLT